MFRTVHWFSPMQSRRGLLFPQTQKAPPTLLRPICKWCSRSEGALLWLGGIFPPHPRHIAPLISDPRLVRGMMYVCMPPCSSPPPFIFTLGWGFQRAECRHRFCIAGIYTCMFWDRSHEKKHEVMGAQNCFLPCFVQCLKLKKSCRINWAYFSCWWVLQPPK
jgi:hypothetical protein